MLRLREEFKQYRAFLLDCDGVLWKAGKPIPGAAEALKHLRESGLRVVFVTNNSTLSRKGYVRKMREMGIDARTEDVVPSSYATAVYLSRAPGTAYVVGGPGLVEELASAGIDVVLDLPQVDYVVVGMDPYLTYGKLLRAMRYIRKGARFIATNPDPTCPVADGEAPGAGAIVSALTTCTGKPPDVVIGKPSPEIMKIALETAGVKASEALMVGDRIETDVAGAVNAGIDSALVLTGVSSLDDVQRSAVKPKYVLRTLLDLFED